MIMIKNFEKYPSATLALLMALYFTPLAFAKAEQALLTPCPYSWTRNLRIGATGDDVLKLQQFLNTDTSTTIAPSGTGSAGHESGVYGILTSRAVTKFQEKYKSDTLSPMVLTNGTGLVGTLTRAKLNTLCIAPTVNIQASTIPDTATTTFDTLVVSDPGQPASSIASAGAGGVPFISVTLAAGNKDVTINNIAVRRIGLGADDAFANIALNDPSGLQIGDVVSLNSNHIATFRQPFTILAHTSETLTIVGNLASDLSNFVGQMPSLEIDSINASSPVVGSLPLKGVAQTLNNSLTIGSVLATVSSFDPQTSLKRYIGDTGVRFSGIQMTASSQEDITLSSIIWYQSGTASASDLANVTTLANGTSSPAVVRPDGKTYVSVFTPGIVIPKGQSIDVYLQGDLKTTGANRTVEFDISDNTDDVALTGDSYGFGDGISPSGNTATSGHSVFITSDGSTGGNTGTPFYAGSVTSISGGTLTSVGKATQ